LERIRSTSNDQSMKFYLVFRCVSRLTLGRYPKIVNQNVSEDIFYLAYYCLAP